MEITFEVFNVVKSAKTWKNTPRRGFKMRMRLDGQVECSAARFLRGRDKNWGCQKGPMPRWHANGPTSLDGGTDSGQMCHLRREKHGAARRRLLFAVDDGMDPGDSRGTMQRWEDKEWDGKALSSSCYTQCVSVSPEVGCPLSEHCHSLTMTILQGMYVQTFWSLNLVEKFLLSCHLIQF